jgi:DNA-binding Lrp family transcriptional regulator
MAFNKDISEAVKLDDRDRTLLTILRKDSQHCLILKVRIGSPEALGRLLTDLKKVPGIERTETSIVLGTYWSRERIC